MSDISPLCLCLISLSQLNLQWNVDIVNYKPPLKFHWMDPILGLSRLLLNPEVRNALVTDPRRLAEHVPPDHVAGHFMNAKIAEIVSRLIPTAIGASNRPVIPLFMGMWSDSSQVSHGGNINRRKKVAGEKKKGETSRRDSRGIEASQECNEQNKEE